MRRLDKKFGDDAPSRPAGVWYHRRAVSLSIPLTWSDAHRGHEPGAEIYVGMRTPGTEVAERAERIREALEAAGVRTVEARPHPDAALRAVHSPELLAYLEGAWEAWAAAGLNRDPGQDRVVPYLFPHPGLLGDLTPADPAAAAARAGAFAFDTMTLIGPGTWEAARGAADAALTAVDLVADGERAAYACCRPPGHHVTRTAFGGSCYLNNAAIAAAALRERVGGSVALIDIDAHHGNGAQSIFWEDPGVLTGSVHVDPGAGWFPHFLGFAAETGAGDGEGTNLNLPLPPGTGDAEWLAAVERLADRAADSGAVGLVVALGVDAAGGDPESPLEVTSEGYEAAGRTLAALGLPTVVVQEGGYDLDTIGGLVLAFLLGFG
jgi:acetoin utilization deacetylase AcuC-like enzyme